MKSIDKKDLNICPILIIIPVFNDWKSLEMLLVHLDQVLQNRDLSIQVIVVDDASTVSISENYLISNFTVLKKVDILRLRRNLGHQRAIAIGLAYVEANVPCRAVVVMDGDGEDDPKDVLRLIEKCSQEEYKKVVFARRIKRSESTGFKVFYFFYKSLYKLLTGQQINVGNFSIIPYSILSRVVVISELWNHYAAAVLKAKVPYIEIPSRRSTRLAGESKMNFVLLVTHGLSAISVYGDVVGVRLLVATCLLIAFTIFGILAIVFIKIFTNLAIPGWASYMGSLLFIIFVQAIMVSMFFIFTVLNARNYYSFIPQRDYHSFILELREVFISS